MRVRVPRPLHAPHVAEKVSRLSSRAQFALFLGGTVIITLVLTVISYTLYVVSGTSQLDLSRPGYKQALSEVSPTDTDDSSYSATGPLNRSALNEFREKYDNLVGKTKNYSAFDPGAMSDDQLNLTDPAVSGTDDAATPTSP